MSRIGSALVAVLLVTGGMGATGGDGALACDPGERGVGGLCRLSAAVSDRQPRRTGAHTLEVLGGRPG